MSISHLLNNLFPDFRFAGVALVSAWMEKITEGEKTNLAPKNLNVSWLYAFYTLWSVYHSRR